MTYGMAVDVPTEKGSRASTNNGIYFMYLSSSGLGTIEERRCCFVIGNNRDIAKYINYIMIRRSQLIWKYASIMSELIIHALYLDTNYAKPYFNTMSCIMQCLMCDCILMNLTENIIVVQSVVTDFLSCTIIRWYILSFHKPMLLV